MSKETLATEKSTVGALQDSMKEIGQDLKKKIVDDEKPIDQEVPGVAFSLVTFSYLGMLVLVIVGFLVAYRFFF